MLNRAENAPVGVVAEMILLEEQRGFARRRTLEAGAVDLVVMTTQEDHQNQQVRCPM